MGRTVFRAEFDPRREFVTRQDFLFDGKPYVVGQAIDKGRFTTRRLRQLYDVRRIEFAPEVPASKPRVEPLPPAPPLATQRYRPRNPLARRKLELT
jgi:hypothetical protein